MIHAKYGRQLFMHSSKRFLSNQAAKTLPTKIYLQEKFIEFQYTLQKHIIAKDNSKIREYLDVQMKEGKVTATDIYLSMREFDVESSQKELQASQFYLLDVMRQYLDQKKEMSISDTYLVTLGLAMWVKNSREKDISFFRPLYNEYSDSFKQLDTHLETAFKASVQSTNLDHKFLSLHTLYQSSKSNLFPQTLYHILQPHTLSLLQQVSQSASPGRYASPMDYLRVFNSFLRCADFVNHKGNLLRKHLVHEHFVKDFYRLSALELSSLLLQGQLSMDDTLLADRMEHVKIGRIMKQLEAKFNHVKKMDSNSLKKLYTSILMTKDGRYFDRHHSIEQFPKLMKFNEEVMIPQFEGKVNQSTPYKSDSQKRFMRLINQAFGSSSQIKAEVAVQIYQIDLVLEMGDKKIGIEISDPLTKQFRTGYTTPSHRIREKILKKNHGYHMIEIDTHSFPNFDQQSDSQQLQLVKDYILYKLNQ